MYKYQARYQTITLGGIKRSFTCNITSKEPLGHHEVYLKAFRAAKAKMVLAGERFHFLSYHEEKPKGK